MNKALLITLLPLLMTMAAQAQTNSQQDPIFKPSGKLSGYVFGDYAYKLDADEAQRGSQQYSALKKDYNSFNIRRLYLQYGYRFSPDISAHITLAHESGMEVSKDKTNLLPDGNRTVFVKHAYIQAANIIPNAAIVFGQQATPTFSRLSESFWGYRSIEKTVADGRGISSSSDLGVGLYGKIGEQLGYDILYANNSGTKFVTHTHKKLYTSLYAYFLNKKLVAQINYEYNKTSPFADISGNTQLVKAFVAYKTSKTTIGAEAFRQFNKNAVQYTPAAGSIDSLTTGKAATGLSLFFNQTLKPKKLSVFVRMDFFNPDVNFKTDRIYLNRYSLTKEIFATIGIDYELFKNIHIMPNLWLNHYESRNVNNSAAPKNGSDLVGRITFYYVFNK